MVSANGRPRRAQPRSTSGASDPAVESGIVPVDARNATGIRPAPRSDDNRGRRRAARRSPRSDVEQEVQHVSVLDDVLLARGAPLPRLLRAVLALAGAV